MMDMCNVDIVLKLLILVCIVCVIYLTRKFISGGVCKSDTRLDGKTVVITGGNDGIGKETAKDLAKRGARIVMLCRDTEKAKKVSEDIICKLPAADVVIYHCDLSSFSSVRQCAQDVLKSEQRIDILINNAGIACTLQSKSEDGYEKQFATNYLGHFLLTNLLLDKLKQSAPSRIINVSSIVHHLGKVHLDDINLEKNYNKFKAYYQSKLALIYLTRELSRRVKDSNVHVYAVHPGGVRTNLGRHLQSFGSFMFFLCGLIAFKSPKQGAQTTIYCAVDEHAGTHTGLYYSDCKITKPARHATDDKIAKQLWELSCKWTKLTDN